MNKSLTVKQKLFIKAYIKYRNATKSALEAGYSKKTAEKIGSENLQKPEIKKEIDRQIGKALDRYDCSIDNIARELSYIGFARADDVVDWNDEKIEIKESEDLGESAIATIRSIEETPLTYEGKVYAHKRKVKFHDKVKALEILAKYRGMFYDGPKQNEVDKRSGEDSVERLLQIIGKRKERK